MSWLLKKIFIITICAAALFSGGAFADQGIDTKEIEVYKRVIMPWLDRWFKEHSFEVVLKEDMTIKRELIKKDLSNVVKVEGKDLYSVRVLYIVDIHDRPSGVKVWGIKEQEIVFWLDGIRVKDYYPSEDYWIEKPRYTPITDAVNI